MQGRLKTGICVYHSELVQWQGRVKTGNCVYHSKLVQWQGRVKTGNLAEFRKIKHFFDENDKNGHRVPIVAQCWKSVQHSATIGRSATAIYFTHCSVERRARWRK